MKQTSAKNENEIMLNVNGYQGLLFFLSMHV